MDSYIVDFFNWFDVIALLTMFAMAMIGLSRGFSKESTSFLSWFGAVIITALIVPHIKHIAEGYIPNSLIAIILTSIATFVGVITILAIIGYYLRGIISSILPTETDRSLGLGFGIAKAYLIFSAIFLVTAAIYPKIAMKNTDDSGKPKFIAEARTAPFFKIGADFIGLMLPGVDFGDYIDDVAGLAGKDDLKEILVNNFDEKSEDIGKDLKIFSKMIKLIPDSDAVFLYFKHKGHFDKNEGNINQLLYDLVNSYEKAAENDPKKQKIDEEDLIRIKTVLNTEIPTETEEETTEETSEITSDEEPEQQEEAEFEDLDELIDELNAE